jgi:ABC-type transport system involved in cytochrome bd biosynthesis fused ATPase/permease subunit
LNFKFPFFGAFLATRRRRRRRRRKKKKTKKKKSYKTQITSFSSAIAEFALARRQHTERKTQARTCRSEPARSQEI